MKSLKMFSFILLQVVGFMSLPPNFLFGQSPPAQNCLGVSVAWASSAAFAPLTATGTGAPRICLPQCSTSVATCTAGQATTITPTFSGLGTGSITTRTWTVEGDIAINGVNNGATVSIYSTLSNTAPLQFGKGRLKLAYTYLVGTCSCAGFVTLDVYKTANPLPTTNIVGPTCVAIGEQVAYSIAPDFSRNVGIGIGVDNNYSWTVPTGFQTTPPGGYTSGEFSGQTFTVLPVFTTGSLSIKPGNNLASGTPAIPGTGCNTATVTLGPIGRKARSFNLLATQVPAVTGYTFTANSTNAVRLCADFGLLAECTLEVVAPVEADATFEFTATAGSGITTIPISSSKHRIIFANGTSVGTVSVRSSVLNGCQSANATLTVTRGVAPGSTLTCQNCPTPVPNTPAGEICFRANTSYNFLLSGPFGPTNVTAANLGLPTALGTWSWTPATNILSVLTPNTNGSATTFPIALNNVTCAGGNIVANNIYKRAQDQATTFTIPLTATCGRFTISGSPSLSQACLASLSYTWTGSAGTVWLTPAGSRAGCGFFNVQVDPDDASNVGKVINCVVGASCTNGCNSCKNFTPITQPISVTITAAMLAGCPVLRPISLDGTENRLSLKEHDFNLDPNPTTKLLSINILTKEKYESTAKITDLNGKSLFKSNFEGSKFDVDVSNFSSGIYMISVQNKFGLKTRRFVKN